MQKAISVFGERGPSTHRKTRQDQVAELSTEGDETLRDLDKRWYVKAESIDALLQKFAVGNVAVFRDAASTNTALDGRDHKTTPPRSSADSPS